MKNIYNIDEDDVWWSASDIGWIVGHSYIVYAPLFKGCTTVLFEGKPVGTPDASGVPTGLPSNSTVVHPLNSGA